MRIASFNVENLFDRAIALALPTWEDGRKVLGQHAKINQLLNEPTYTDSIKKQIVDLLKALDLDREDDGGKFAILRQNRGKLLKRPQAGGVEIVAHGRSSWLGWVDLKREPVDELTTQHTAMMIDEVDADVLGVVEADNRIALKEFSDFMLKKVGGTPYPHVMLIDGNDDRGIDVGVLTKTGFDIVDIRSHVDDEDAVGEVFSRDCPEYTITTPAGNRLVLLVNHLKSKGFGSQASSNAKRLRQATRVVAIYNRLRQEGEKHIAIVGDLNDHPEGAPLAPLLTGTDLKDISQHPSFSSDGHLGTFGNGKKFDKFDYVLLSPALFQKVTGGGVNRKGIWGENKSLALVAAVSDAAGSWSRARRIRPRRDFRRRQHLAPRHGRSGGPRP